MNSFIIYSSLHQACSLSIDSLVTWFLDLYPGECVSADSKETWIWNKDTRLWELTHRLPIYIGIKLNQEIDRVISELQTSHWNYQMNKLGALRLKIGTYSVQYKISKYVQRAVHDPTFKVNFIPHELPVKSGKIIDLRTKQVRWRQLSDRWSFECPVEYNPDATFDLSSYLDDLTLGDTDLQYYLQTVLGQCLTGEIGTYRTYFLVGSSGGRSTLIHLMKATLGPLFGYYGWNHVPDCRLMCIRNMNVIKYSEYIGPPIPISKQVKFLVLGDTLPPKFVNIIPFPTQFVEQIQSDNQRLANPELFSSWVSSPDTMSSFLNWLIHGAWLSYNDPDVWRKPESVVRAMNHHATSF